MGSQRVRHNWVTELNWTECWQQHEATDTHTLLVLIAQSCLSLCDPMDCSPPGSSVHGMSQAGILQWLAISFSRASSWARDRICIPCIGRWVLYHWATWKAPRDYTNVQWTSKKVPDTIRKSKQTNLSNFINNKILPHTTEWLNKEVWQKPRTWFNYADQQEFSYSDNRSADCLRIWHSLLSWIYA